MYAIVDDKRKRVYKKGGKFIVFEKREKVVKPSDVKKTKSPLKSPVRICPPKCRPRSKARSKSKSPRRRTRSKTPKRTRSKSKSPRRRTRSKTPKRTRSKSKSPRRRTRSKSRSKASPKRRTVRQKKVKPTSEADMLRQQIIEKTREFEEIKRGWEIRYQEILEDAAKTHAEHEPLIRRQQETILAQQEKLIECDVHKARIQSLENEIAADVELKAEFDQELAIARSNLSQSQKELENLRKEFSQQEELISRLSIDIQREIEKKNEILFSQNKAYDDEIKYLKQHIQNAEYNESLAKGQLALCNIEKEQMAEQFTNETKAITDKFENESRDLAEKYHQGAKEMSEYYTGLAEEVDYRRQTEGKYFEQFMECETERAKLDVRLETLERDDAKLIKMCEKATKKLRTTIEQMRYNEQVAAKYFEQLEDCNKNVEALYENVRSAEERAANFNTIIQDLNRQLVESDITNNAKREVLVKRCTKRVNALQTEYDDLMRINANLMDVNKKMKARIDDEDLSIANILERKEKEREQLDRLSHSIQEFNTELFQKLKNCEAENNKIKEENALLRRDIERSTESRESSVKPEELDYYRNELQRVLDQSEAERTRILEDAEQLRVSQVQALQNEIENMTSVFEEVRENDTSRFNSVIAGLQTEIQELAGSRYNVDELRDEIQELRIQNNTYENQLISCRMKDQFIQELQLKIQELERSHPGVSVIKDLHNEIDSLRDEIAEYEQQLLSCSVDKVNRATLEDLYRKNEDLEAQNVALRSTIECATSHNPEFAEELQNCYTPLED